MAGRPRTQLKKVAQLDLLTRQIAAGLRSGPFKSCIDGGRTDELALAWRKVWAAVFDVRKGLISVADVLCRKHKLAWFDYEAKYMSKGFKLAVPGLPDGSDLANDAQDEDDEVGDDDDSVADCSTDVCA
jgi:hypothetical protein